MRDQSVSSVIEAAMSSPKVGYLVAGSTASVGAASKFEIINGWLAVGSMIIGITTGFTVLVIQLIRLERAWRERRKAIMEGLL